MLKSSVCEKNKIKKPKINIKKFFLIKKRSTSSSKKRAKVTNFKQTKKKNFFN